MENKQLQKSLGVGAALSTVVGMVIGGGVFFKPQAVYTLTGGAPGLGMLTWVLAGIVTIAAGLTAAEVSAAIPKTGGMMVYIEEIYGKYGVDKLLFASQYPELPYAGTLGLVYFADIPSVDKEKILYKNWEGIKYGNN